MTLRRALFQGLIDYAGLFPPAQLSMQPAVEEYRTIRCGPYSWIAGRFIVPVSRIAELTASIGPTPIQICAIADAGSDSREWFRNAQSRVGDLAAVRQSSLLEVAAIEVAVPALTAARETFDPVIGQFAMLAHSAALGDLPVYVELPRGPRFEELLPSAMFALARSKLGAKLRCGGVEPEAFPSAAEVAAFLLAAHEYDVPFKATAGLHHPIRAVEPSSGLLMHGFINLLAASVFVRGGSDRAELEAILEERDPAAFSVTDEHFGWRDRFVDVAEVAQMRARGFIAYGSCSFLEPVGDLVALGMLDAMPTAV